MQIGSVDQQCRWPAIGQIILEARSTSRDVAASAATTYITRCCRQPCEESASRSAWWNCRLLLQPTTHRNYESRQQQKPSILSIIDSCIDAVAFRRSPTRFFCTRFA